jgi:hypothetical protein
VGKFLLEVLNKIIEFMADIALLMEASIKELLEANMPDGKGDFFWPDGIKYSGQWR